MRSVTDRTGRVGIVGLGVVVAQHGVEECQRRRLAEALARGQRANRALVAAGARVAISE